MNSLALQYKQTQFSKRTWFPGLRLGLEKSSSPISAYPGQVYLPCTLTCSQHSEGGVLTRKPTHLYLFAQTKPRNEAMKPCSRTILKKPRGRGIGSGYAATFLCLAHTRGNGWVRHIWEHPSQRTPQILIDWSMMHRKPVAEQRTEPKSLPSHVIALTAKPSFLPLLYWGTEMTDRTSKDSSAAHFNMYSPHPHSQCKLFWKSGPQCFYASGSLRKSYSHWPRNQAHQICQQNKRGNKIKPTFGWQKIFEPKPLC